MGEYSFIVEFDEMSKNQINKLWEYLSERNIKFHVLKDEDLKNENQELKKQQKEFIDYLEDGIYTIEPKGTLINFYCDYDSEEDYIRGVEKRVKLDTLKNILSKYKEIIGEHE